MPTSVPTQRHNRDLTPRHFDSRLDCPSAKTPVPRAGVTFLEPILRLLCLEFSSLIRFRFCPTPFLSAKRFVARAVSPPFVATSLAVREFLSAGIFLSLFPNCLNPSVPTLFAVYSLLPPIHVCIFSPFVFFFTAFPFTKFEGQGKVIFPLPVP